jgi:hypothetical protein
MKSSPRRLFLAVLVLQFVSSAFAIYDPRLGRWLSRDSLREEGGFNLYAYCGNDPVNRHDPLGLAEMGKWDYDPYTGAFGFVSDYNRYYFGAAATLNGQVSWTFEDTHPIDQPIAALGGRSMTMVFGPMGARGLYGGAELFSGAALGAIPGLGPYMASRSATERWLEFSDMDQGHLRTLTGMQATVESLGTLLYVAAPWAASETPLFRGNRMQSHAGVP